MMLTADSMDDSLIQRRQKEIDALKEEIAALKAQLVITEGNHRAYIQKYKDEVAKNKELSQYNKELEKKLLIHEHDPIIKEVYTDYVKVLYWDTETNKYETFAIFYRNTLEEDLEDFCDDFILEMKDAYMVE